MSDLRPSLLCQQTATPPIVLQLPVAAGCAFCLVLSAVCFVLLTAHICLRNSCLVFLKLQASAAVLGAMAVFLLASAASVPEVSAVDPTHSPNPLIACEC